jgi:hypothetical protein
VKRYLPVLAIEGHEHSKDCLPETLGVEGSDKIRLQLTIACQKRLLLGAELSDSCGVRSKPHGDVLVLRIIGCVLVIELVPIIDFLFFSFKKGVVADEQLRQKSRELSIVL